MRKRARGFLLAIAPFAVSGQAPPVAAPLVPELTVKLPPPDYPKAASEAGLQGTVALTVEATPEGKIESIRVVRGLGLGLDEKAVAVVREAMTSVRGSPTANFRDTLTIPFMLPTPTPWRIDGWTFRRTEGREMTRFSATLVKYQSPDPEACQYRQALVPINLQIGDDGTPSSIQFGPGVQDRLGKAVIEAVQSWRFNPALGRRPRATSGTVLLVCERSGAPEDLAGLSAGDPTKVSPPRLAFKIDPEYSEQARKAKYSGSVQLRVLVASDGQARSLQVLKSLGMGLDEEAVLAVRQWRFKPAVKDGKPVGVITTIEVNFKLL